MNNSNYFKDMFESITDYRKIPLFLIQIQNDTKFHKRNRI